MVIDRDIYYSILSKLPPVPPETGCVLGAQNGVITTYVYDAGILQCNVAAYEPQIDVLNHVIMQWSKMDVQFLGIAHSHPNGQTSLSSGDVKYIHSIMNTMPHSVNTLFFPLVFPGDKIISYVALKSSGEVKIIPDNIILIK